MRFAEAKIHMFLKSSTFPVMLAIVQVQNLGFGRGGSIYIYIYIYILGLLFFDGILGLG